MTHPSAGSGQLKVRRINPRVIALLTGLFLLICVLVIATDGLSPRDRTPPQTAASGPASLPSTAPSSAPAPAPF